MPQSVISATFHSFKAPMRLQPATAVVSALSAGALLMFVLVPVMGYSNAIAAPQGFFEWFRSHLTIELGALVWDMLVVYGIPVGLPVALATIVVCWRSTLPKYAVAGLVVVGSLIALYVLLPLYYGEPQTRLLPWWASSLEFSILLGAALGALTWRRGGTS